GRRFTSTSSTRMTTRCPTCWTCTSPTFAPNWAKISFRLAAAWGTSSMVRSLRGRLQLWYGLVLTAAVVGFAVILYSRAQVTTYEQIDGNLIAAAEYLDAALRSLPMGLLESPPPDGRPSADGKAPFGMKGRPDMKGPPDGKGRPKGMPPRRQPERR